jgi:hypothetical protein
MHAIIKVHYVPIMKSQNAHMHYQTILIMHMHYVFRTHISVAIYVCCSYHIVLVQAAMHVM